MKSINYKMMAWAVCLGCMLCSCHVSRKVSEKTEIRRMEDVKISSEQKEIGIDELLRRVKEKEDLHLVWYMPEGNIEGTERPPVAAEAWITRQKESEETDKNEQRVERREDENVSIREQEHRERHTETKARTWPEWWEIMLVVIVSGSGIGWSILQGKKK